MYNFTECKLGVTGKEIDIELLEDNCKAAVSMVQQSRRSLEIISRALDPKIFDATDFIEAIRQLIAQNRKPVIRIIVFDVEKIVKNGRRLVDMAGNLTSFIQIRKAHDQYSNFNACLLIADGVGYIHRDNNDRYEAKLNFNDRRVSKKMRWDFDEMWESAKHDPNLRRVNL